MQGLRKVLPIIRLWPSRFSRKQCPSTGGFDRPEARESSYAHAYANRARAVLLLATTGVVTVSALDDFLVYWQCSRKAIKMAAGDNRLKESLGNTIGRTRWFDATIAFANGGRSAYCSVPISGERGTLELRLRAISSEEAGKWRIVYRFLAQENWEILVLDALVPVDNGQMKKVQHINLMDTSDVLKPGNEGKLTCCKANSADKL